MRGRRGIALPAVLLALSALGVLSSLALLDALLAWRAADLAEDGVRARAYALAGVPRSFMPPDVAWLCLQPPARPIRQRITVGSGAVVDLAWWSLGGGAIRAEVTAEGRRGARHRVLVSLRVDSLAADSLGPGCPAASRLLPRGDVWMRPAPTG